MVSPPVTCQQNMLVQLVLHILSSPHNPTGSLRVQALINETGTKLVSLRTELLDFIQDDSEPANMPASIASFINLGLFMSTVFGDATKRPAYPLDCHDLESLGQVGVELITGITQADKDLICLNIFKVCITWFDENEEFWSKALSKSTTCTSARTGCSAFGFRLAGAHCGRRVSSSVRES